MKTQLNVSAFICSNQWQDPLHYCLRMQDQAFNIAITYIWP